MTATSRRREPAPGRTEQTSRTAAACLGVGIGWSAVYW